MNNRLWLLMTDNHKIGGASRDRTDDPLLAKQVLSQLSYGPDIEVRKQMSEDRRSRFSGFCFLASDF